MLKQFLLAAGLATLATGALAEDKELLRIIGEDKQFPQLTVLSIAPLLAQTIREVFENGSVTSLFNGHA